ncbi:MAG: hypothetical protein ISS15_10950 [Alphaproteobacteria bacterium]|nr:hypothetical protein [Alphaproteobacteria bacterium]MBL6939976.1 hypothetical protein [Alphaproteobacteria bacterium]MBL7098168.1 hypothetical protein [Alphaproteobacteria bacterium]
MRWVESWATPQQTPEAHSELPADATLRQVVHLSIGRKTLRVHNVHGGDYPAVHGGGYHHPDVKNEADRQAVNAWLRAPGHFDAVIDFDAVIRDPAAPSYMNRLYDVGDHLHPDPAGYKAMADSIPLGLFK